MIAALVLVAAIPALDVDNTSRLLLVLVAAVLAYVWWHSSFATPGRRTADPTSTAARPWGGPPGGSSAGRCGLSATAGTGSDGSGSLPLMAFEQPPPDLSKLIAAWEQLETGEESPGRVLANLKTAGSARGPAPARRLGLGSELSGLAHSKTRSLGLASGLRGARLAVHPPPGGVGARRPAATPRHPLTVSVPTSPPRSPTHARPARSSPAFQDARPSAVLIALADGPSGAEVLLTRRSSTCATTAARSASPAAASTRARRRSRPRCARPTRRSGSTPPRSTLIGELDHLEHRRQPQLHRARRRPPARRRCALRADERRGRARASGCRWPSSSGPTRTAPSAGARRRPTACCTSSSSTTRRCGAPRRRSSSTCSSRLA